MNIRLYRKKRGMTQAELGEAIGVTSTIISRYESGIVTPPAEKIMRIAKTLEVPIEDLIGEEMTEEDRRDVIMSFPVRYGKDFSDIALRHFSLLNINIVNSPGTVPFDLIAFESGKKWCLNTYSLIDVDSKKIPLKNKLYECVGMAAFVQDIKKVSIITDISLDRFIAAIPQKIQADALGFDVSLIHINMEELRLDSEYELVTHYDGRGYFDLAVPGKEAESARLFAAWKSSLSTPIPKANDGADDAVTDKLKRSQENDPASDSTMEAMQSIDHSEQSGDN